MDEIYSRAKKLMKGYCRVCPVCDGKACAGEVPGMGGLGTAASFKANISALSGFRFNMRLLHDVKEPDTSVTMFEKKLALPVLAAPIGGVSFNMGGGITEQEYSSAVIQGSIAKGTLGCTGDGVPDFIHLSGLQAIEDAGGMGIPFIKPWEEQELFDKLDKAQATGAEIVGIDIDAAGLVTLRQMGRPVGPKNEAELKTIREAVKGKLILKGIMTVADAKRAVDCGADGIVVSNHGGRVLDFTPGAAEVLPQINAAVKGQVEILADGGVRTGGDVLKLLALGADGVMIGRPLSVAAVGGLKDGVEKYFDKIELELQQAMVLTGAQSVKDVDPSILYQKHLIV
jgi:4-hydroxymandelate oxidase